MTDPEPMAVYRHHTVKCPKCGNRRGLTFLGGRAAIVDYFYGTLWAKDSVLDLLPDELLGVTCQCGFTEPALPQDRREPWILFCMVDGEAVPYD
jgi:predicted nucleic-acid-binding Zn-ribbon protein